MNNLCSEPQRDHIPPSLERLLSEFDTKSFKLEKQTFEIEENASRMLKLKVEKELAKKSRQPKKKVAGAAN